MKPGGNVTSESGTSCSSGIKCHTVEAAEESQLEVDATLLLSLHHQEMSFKATTKSFIKHVNAKKTFIPNESLEKEQQLLRIVRVRKSKFIGPDNYEVLDCTLPQLVGEKYEPVNEKDDEWVKDFKASAKTGICVNVKGGDEAVAKGEVSANMDVTDAMVKSVNIRKKTADLEVIRKTFSGKSIMKGTLKPLIKTEILAFVYERAYNTIPVTITRMKKQEGRAEVLYQNIGMVNSGNKKNQIEFTVPENSAFAYSLVEIKQEDGKIEIPFETLTVKKGLVHDAIDDEIITKLRQEIEDHEHLLKPIKDLEQSTRLALLKNLREVLEEEDALRELQDALDQDSPGTSNPPASKAVSSFMDLLNLPQKSTSVKDALYFLVSTLDGLPVKNQRTLIAATPETLKVLSQLVESLVDDGEAHLPASVPAPLREDGDLSWAADLLCSSDETLAELRDTWGLDPEVLLLVLVLTVMALQKLQL